MAAHNQHHARGGQFVQKADPRMGRKLQFRQVFSQAAQATYYVLCILKLDVGSCPGSGWYLPGRWAAIAPLGGLDWYIGPVFAAPGSG